MATQSRGKKFEARFKQDWATYVPDSFCYRLYDVTSGYYGVRGISDFICYKEPYLYLIDCKSHDGNTVSFNDFSQYESMLGVKDIPGVVAGTMIWFCERDRVIWVPIQTWEKLKLEDKKSFNIKYVEDSNYETLEIPSKKLRTFMESDYSTLIEYYKGKFNG